jgi:transglutaminase-like putative cysteine protease
MAALARAAGLPARIVVGVVYTGEGFFYHAWNEVWVGDWISLDPVMGQFPADVTHVKFVDGGLEEQTRMARVIGRLSMEILEYR